MNKERIEFELSKLSEGGQKAELILSPRAVVLYRDVPTQCSSLGLPATTDVVVPIPEGYAASMIDLAGLPIDSPFLPKVKGGQNNQGVIVVNGRQWQLASYHPHNGGGGPAWDQVKHGFHTYIDHLISWLHHIN